MDGLVFHFLMTCDLMHIDSVCHVGLVVNMNSLIGNVPQFYAKESISIKCSQPSKRLIDLKKPMPFFRYYQLNSTLGLYKYFADEEGKLTEIAGSRQIFFSFLKHSTPSIGTMLPVKLTTFSTHSDRSSGL